MSSLKVHCASNIHGFLHVKCFSNHFPRMGHYHQQGIEERHFQHISRNKHFGKKPCVGQRDMILDYVETTDLLGSFFVGGLLFQPFVKNILKNQS